MSAISVQARSARDLLRGRGFRRLIGAQLLSQTADGLFQIALASVLIFDVSTARTPGQVTKILAVTLIPFSLVGPFTGPFIDRFSRRSILVGSSLVRAGLTLALVPAVGWSEPPLLALAVAVVSVNRFFHATKSAVLPTVVDRERYLLANTVSTTVGMVFGLLGAVVGGPLADTFGERLPITMAVVLMLAASATAASLALPRGERRGLTGVASEVRDNLRDVRDGLRVLTRSRPAAYAVSAIWSIRGLLGFVLLTALVLARARLDIGATGFSALLAATAVGSFVGAVLVPAAALRVQHRGVAPLAFLVGGLGILAMGPIPAWPAVLGGVFVAGLVMAMTKITSDTLVQRSIGDHYRGRAFAVYDIGYNGIFVLAALIPTVLRPVLGDIGMVVLTGGLYLVGAMTFRVWGARLPAALEVRCYAGARGDEVPREVVEDGSVTRVAEVERSWHEDRNGERLLCFRLRLADGRRIEVSRGEEWRLDRRIS